jgi:anti-sigma regulatory factor (Ser/Thr protein kinase)
MHGAAHEAESILLCVAIGDGTVLVEVWDEGLTGVEPALPDGETDDLGGRGLLLVDALATRWGTRSEGGARCVWFELEL